MRIRLCSWNSAVSLKGGRELSSQSAHVEIDDILARGPTTNISTTQS